MRDDQSMTVSTVPLAVLAMHQGRTEYELVAKYADCVVLDASGLPAIPTALAKADNDALRQKRAALVEESKRKAAEARAAGNPVRERVRAIAKKQQLLGEATDGVGAALGRMQEADGARDAALDRAARDRQEMLDGTTYYHSVAKD